MLIRINRSYKYREIAGEYYLIPTSQAAERSIIPLKLTETAAWIWKQIEASKDIDEIAIAMTEEFEVTLAVASNAVERFVTFLLNHGFLEETQTDESHMNAE